MARSRTTRRAGRAAGVLLGLLAAGLAARAAVESLTLYQKTARAALIVRARALSESTRRPQMRVLEVLKGSYSGETLLVAPHSEDFDTPWIHRETFRKDEESILFLNPYVDEFGRDEGPGTFSLLNADQGKQEVPAEGSEALLEALRRFVAVSTMTQYDQQTAALRGFLTDKNPFIVEAGLAQARKFRLAEPADIETLFSLLDSRRPDFRAGALALLGQIVADERAAGRTDPALRRTAFERVAALARLDPAETVRLEAVSSLEAFGDDAALAIVETLGRTDASQSVRYRAQVAAWHLRARPQ